MEAQDDIRSWAERVGALLRLAESGGVPELTAAYAAYLKALGPEHTIVEAILETCDAEKQNGIHVAASAGNVAAMKWFAEHIDKDILVNLKTKNGTTPLMFAVKGNRVDMTKLLLCWGADVYHADQARLTAIHLALTIEGDSQILELLTANLQPHENLYRPATVTGSLLTWCVLTNNIALFKKLVDISEPKRLADDCFYSTLPCAVVASAHVETAGVILHYLLAKGVAPNAIAGARDQQGSTVLANLAQLDDPTLLARLVEGCTPDCLRELCRTPGEQGKYPVQLATTEGAREILAAFTDDSAASDRVSTDRPTSTTDTTTGPLSESETTTTTTTLIADTTTTTTSTTFGQPVLGTFSPDIVARAELLKQKANTLFGEKAYVEAEATFEEACSLFNVEQLAANPVALAEEVQGLVSTLTANLSVTCLRLQDLDKAEASARLAIHFAPDWYKGYYRLGMVMKARGDFAEASQQMYECVLRNSTDESLKREFTNCLEKAKAQHAASLAQA